MALSARSDIWTQFSLPRRGTAGIAIETEAPNGRLTAGDGQVVLDKDGLLLVSDASSGAVPLSGARVKFKNTFNNDTGYITLGSDLLHFQTDNSVKWTITGALFIVDMLSGGVFQFVATTGNTDILLGGMMRHQEMTAPAGATSEARIFAVDNGGKTELKVIFRTGAAIQIAIEA